MTTASLTRRCSASRRDARPPCRGPGRRSAQLGIAVVAALPDQADRGCDLGVAGAAADQAAQVVAAAREQTEEELAFGRQPRPVAVAAERLGDARDRADLAGGAVAVAPALRGLSGGRCRQRRELELAPRRRTTSADGRTSSMRQPLVAPTSMYSMKRSATSRPRKWRAIGTISWSLVPRLTTMLTLIGPSPARSAASMPRSTSATGKSASFMRRKMASSRASRLTVTRPRPAVRNASAFLSSSEPLVVRVRSSGVRSTWGARQHRHQPLEVAPQQRLAAGEADLPTPWATNSAARRVISSKLSSDDCGRNS